MSVLAQRLLTLIEARRFEQVLLQYARTSERRAWHGARLGMLDEAVRFHASVIIGCDL